jgi:transposase-like protein
MDNLTLKSFYQLFPNEETCLGYLEKMRWPNGRVCPHCGSAKSYKFKNGKLFKCADCKRQFTSKVGTIFTDSHIKLQDWFLAIYLLTSQKKGISSIRLAEYLEVTQKTAWFMLYRIRYAMEYGVDDKQSDANIELAPKTFDETVKKISEAPTPKNKK